VNVHEDKKDTVAIIEQGTLKDQGDATTTTRGNKTISRLIVNKRGAPNLKECV
jgi:hypothetical protein